MKYSDGFWMNKSGYDVNYATQIYEVKATDNSITVYATNQWIGNRGMTLGGPVLEITFTSTLADSGSAAAGRLTRVRIKTKATVITDL